MEDDCLYDDNTLTPNDKEDFNDENRTSSKKNVIRQSVAFGRVLVFGGRSTLRKGETIHILKHTTYMMKTSWLATCKRWWGADIILSQSKIWRKVVMKKCSLAECHKTNDMKVL